MRRVAALVAFLGLLLGGVFLLFVFIGDDRSYTVEYREDEAREALAAEGLDPATLVADGEDLTLSVEVSWASDEQVLLVWAAAFSALSLHGDGAMTIVSTIHGEPWLSAKATASDVLMLVLGEIDDDEFFARAQFTAHEHPTRDASPLLAELQGTNGL